MLIAAGALLLVVASSIAPTLCAGLQLATGWAVFGEDGIRVSSSVAHPDIDALPDDDPGSGADAARRPRLRP